jgi:branched-chain amino acid transport system permease protein
MGINGIPQVVGWGSLLVYVAVLVYLVAAMGASSIGRVFDTARQDETVAVSLGMSVTRYHALAFAMSGCVGGLTGGFYAFFFHSITPDQFGFSLLVTTLAAVVLGGRVSVFGPLVGAVIMTVLPEVARPLADQRYLVDGALLMIAIIYLPDGIVDTLKYRLEQRGLKRSARKLAGGQHAASTR